jgi:CubicO group peptidase (beta-lactamase class C family)
VAVSRREFIVQTSQSLAASLLSSVAVTAQRGSGLPSGISSRITEYLDTRIPQLLARTKVPGLAAAVVKDAKLVWRHAYGVADVETGRRVTDDTIFEAGSVSKTVFAYAALKLCDSGVLSLDTPLTKYSAIRPLEDPRVDGITVRRVLSHTTGLPNFRSPNRPLGFAFSPGERWLYSGEGYWYLQSVITDMLGQVDRDRCSMFEADLRVCASDIGEYLKKNLLDPFGMTTSGYLWNDDYERRAAQGHDESGRVRKPRRRADAVANARYAAVGGLHTTASEYASFLLEVLDPKPADSYRLSRMLRDEMIRPQVKVDAQSSWALGWQIPQGPETDLLFHTGDNPGFKAFVLASVPRRSGWIMFMNGDNARPLLQEFLDAKSPLNDLFKS